MKSYLVLELIDEPLHTLAVLAILIGLEALLLDAAFGFTQIFVRIGESTHFGIEFGFELADARIHLGHGLFTVFQSVLVRFVRLVSQLFCLKIQKWAILSKSRVP